MKIRTPKIYQKYVQILQRLVFRFNLSKEAKVLKSGENLGSEDKKVHSIDLD